MHSKVTAAKSKLDSISSLVLAAVAVIMLVMYVSDRMTSQRGPVSSSERTGPIKNWREEVRDGIYFGPDGADVIISTFMDFQCPFCRRMAFVLDSLREGYRGEAKKLGFVFLHFPLGNHKFAVPAAVVAECSLQQDRFEQMHHLLFKKQDSLGLKTWESFGKEVGVQDMAAYKKCIRLPADSFPRIAAGLSAGRKNGVRGTPTIWVNGVRFPGYDLARLREYVDRGDAKK